MSVSFRDIILSIPADKWRSDTLFIRPIADDYDLWYATVECKLAPGQEDFVNPAGFTIGRAYLDPENSLPCVICKADGTRIGYIVLRKWYADDSFSWSFYIDRNYQGQGFGKAAARLAVSVYVTADPSRDIKLSAEVANDKAHRLYESIGFVRTGELDGDDIVYRYDK